MKTRQQNTVNMMNLVKTVCENALAIISVIPELLASFNIFKNILTLILSVAKEQSLELKGITQVKNALKISLSRSATIVAVALKTYAHKNKLYDLEKEVNFTEYTIFRLSDLDIQKIAGHILDKATEHAADIIPYGVIAADITTLTNDLQAFTTNYNNPVAAIELRKHYTAKLDELITQANDVLHNEMDGLMKIISKTEPDFYAIYKNARNIIDRHGKTLQQKVSEGIATIYVTATAAIDNSLLESVKVDLIQNAVIIETQFTDENGEVTFDKVKAGQYIVELSQETFNPKQSAEFTIAPGDELSFELSLDASLD
jgi:hypothetical protein